jgi:predicted acylesterase/phospholipase RssA
MPVPVPFEPREVAQEASTDLAVMLTGGGARAAYQVGLLKGIARYFPHLRFEIIVGVSAGAINAAYLAAYRGTLAERDAARMERMNELLRKMAPPERGGLKPIDLLVLRPSVDLGRLAGQYERYLPRKLKLLVRALGANETESPDFVSLLMFEPEYTRRLIEIGESDVDARLPEIHSFLAEEPRLVATG